MTIRSSIRELEDDIYSANMDEELNKTDILLMLGTIADILMKLSNKVEGLEG
jgi:hypothetical protein